MKRWITLFASILMHTCLGVVYAWSTFVPALVRECGISTGLSGLVFGLCIVSFSISMVYSSVLQRKYGITWAGVTGGGLLVAGYTTGALSNGNDYLIIIGFGPLAGVGIGIAYLCPLANAMKWFPGHKGVISGLVVAGFGFGSVVFAKIGQHMLDMQLPILSIMGGIGFVAGVMVLGCSMILFVPPSGDASAPAGEQQPTARGIIKEQPFHLLFIQMFIGTFCGLMIIGNLKMIGIRSGLSDEAGTLAVMFFALGNAAGRILWGLWYDRCGLLAVSACMLCMGCGGVMMAMASDEIGFYGATTIIALSFGGCFVLFAARVADVFGMERVSGIYPLVFLGYGMAGLIGPPIGGLLIDHSDSMLTMYLMVIAFAVAGLAVSRLPTKQVRSHCLFKPTENVTHD